MQPGAYTVGWTTVSTVDGHTLRGSCTSASGPRRLVTSVSSGAASPVASEGWLARLSGLAGGGWCCGSAPRLNSVPSWRWSRHGGVTAGAWIATGSATAVVALLQGQSGRFRAAVFAVAALASIPGDGAQAHAPRAGRDRGARRRQATAALSSLPTSIDKRSATPRAATELYYAA